MPKNILIVDDEKDIVTFVKDFFVDEGYDVSVAFCGEEASAIIEKQDPLLIILDMKMPGIDGPSLLKIVNDKCPSSKVIILTGYGQQYTDKVKGLRYEGFITKPFSAMELVNTAKNILAGKITEKKEGTDLYNDPHIMPKAKLLFIEPKEFAAAGKKIYFLDKEKCGGEYKMDVIVNVKKIEAKLKEFKPDIVLGDIGVLSLQENLRSKIMKSKFKPKDIIVFGHSSESTGDENFVAGQFDPLTALFVKDMMDKLGKIVRETSIANKLYIKSEKPVKVPGLDLKKQDGGKSEEKKKVVTIKDLPDTVRNVVSEHMDIPKEQIKDSAHLVKDLGMNSLQSIQINIDLEDALGFEISDNDAEKLNTLNDIVNYLRKRMTEKK